MTKRTGDLASLAVAAVVVCSAFGCAKKSAIEEDRAPAQVPAPATSFTPPPGAQAVGMPISQSTPVRLAAIRSDVAKYMSKTVLVEATADRVCQAKGCWMTVKDGEGAPIWVRWASGCGGEYAFPKDAAGKRVIVEGTLTEREITAEEAEHYASESPGLDASKIAGKTFEIDATACLVMPESAPSS